MAVEVVIAPHPGEERGDDGAADGMGLGHGPVVAGDDDLLRADPDGSGPQRAAEGVRQAGGEVAAVGGGGEDQDRVVPQDSGQGLRPCARRVRPELGAGGVTGTAQVGRGGGGPRADDEGPAAGLGEGLGRPGRQDPLPHGQHRQRAGPVHGRPRGVAAGEQGGTPSTIPVGGLSHGGGGPGAHRVLPTRSPSMTAAWARRGATQSPMRCTRSPATARSSW